MNEWKHEGTTPPFMTTGRPEWASRPDISGYRIEMRTCGRLAEQRHVWLHSDGTIVYEDWILTPLSFVESDRRRGRLRPVPAVQPDGGYWPGKTVSERIEDRQAEYRELLHRADQGCPFPDDASRKANLLREIEELTAEQLREAPNAGEANARNRD